MPRDRLDDRLASLDDLGHEIAETLEIFLQFQPYECFVLYD
jgi:hypothetical protein